MRCNRAFAVVLAALMGQVAGAQLVLPPLGEPVSGTVKSVATDSVVVVTPKGDVTIKITPQTRVAARQAASESEIKPGAYLGTSNQNGAAPDTGTATEVHLASNGGNVNQPMNDSGLTMTNGHVKKVTRTAKGQEMDVDYGEGKTRHVVVASGTPITNMVDAGIAELKPGIGVMAMTTKGADGKPVASMIVLEPAKAKPRP